MNFTHNGWCVSVHPSAEQIAQAKAMRVERDARFGNHFSELDSDEKWVGDLGEIILNRYFNEHLPSFQWLDGSDGRSVAGEPDFLIGRLPIEIKTVKRQKLIQPTELHYGCQITRSQTHKYPPYMVFIFGSYSTGDNCYQILGGISKRRFDTVSKIFGPGEYVHKNYQVRQGHMIEQGRLKDLSRMDDVLKEVRRYATSNH